MQYFCTTLRKEFCIYDFDEIQKAKSSWNILTTARNGGCLYPGQVIRNNINILSITFTF